MTITIRRWIAAAVTAGAVGVILLATDADQVLGGVLAGVGVGAAPALILVERRSARLDQQQTELRAAREQHDAAFAALTGQRQRLWSTLERMMAGRLAEERAATDRRILQARIEGYELGARHALTGAFTASPQPPEGADVVSLDARRTPVGTR